MSTEREENAEYRMYVHVKYRWGRRRPLMVFNIIAGVALILSQAIPEETGDGASLIPLRIAFRMTGKFGITGSLCIIYLYTPEMFPTTMRSKALGIASFAGRIGNLVAPFTATAMHVVPWLPGLLFGGLTIGSSLLTFVLPETLNRPLPNTIEDIETWSKRVKNKQPTEEPREMPAVDSNGSVAGNAAPADAI